MPESNERSAEWLRGEKAALRRLKPEVWGQGLRAYSTRDLRQLVDSDYFNAEKNLAVAEAREAGEQVIKPGWSDAMAHATSGRVSPGTVTVNDGTPTVAEVIEAAERALGGVAWFLDAGVQESSVAPRCCAICGKVQIDGQNEHHKSCNARDIKSALALIARWKEANGGKTT